VRCMNVEMFIAGWLRVPAGVLREGDDFERQVRLPVPVFVIETDVERILVDTGLHPAAVADPERHYGRSDALGPFRLEAAESIAEQIDLGTITKVVLTHLHFDHAAGLALLPPSLPIVVQRREWEAAHDAAAVARNYYLPGDYAGVDGARVECVDGDHDLLGDGSIQLLLTPGHTPGHQSIKVGDGLVIGGDVTHFASGLDDGRFPIFGDDLSAQAASADRLRGLRDAGATVLPGHDPDALKPGLLLTAA
jgi:N-acyl homoserine lactone hydrolase